MVSEHCGSAKDDIAPEARLRRYIIVGSALPVLFNILAPLRSAILSYNLLLHETEVNIRVEIGRTHVWLLDMSDFSSTLPSSGSKLDSSQKEQLMEQVKAQIAVANAQEILHVSRSLLF